MEVKQPLGRKWKKCSDCDNKVSDYRKVRCANCNYIFRRGKNSSNWAGDQVGYHGLHKWARANVPPQTVCECCGLLPPQDVANVSGNYLRDISDWQRLCRKCHMTQDGRLEKLKELTKLLKPTQIGVNATNYRHGRYVK